MRFHEYFTPQEFAILRQRAERLAANNTDIERIEQTALRVMIGHEYYALPITKLASVYERVSIVRVPCTPSHIVGVTNIRGHIIPVLRLSQLLNTSSDEDVHHVIIANYKDNVIGMSVSKIENILNYFDEDVIPLTGGTHGWLTGVLIDGTALLDLDALLSDPTLIVHDTQLS